MAMTDLSLIKECVGVDQLPERWEAIFPEAAAELERGGCRAADPAYYEYLENRYGIMGGDLGEYKALAEAVSRDEALLSLLALEVSAMRDRSCFAKELGSFRLAEREDDYDRDCFQALAALSLTDHTYRLLKKRGIPEADVRRSLALPVGGLRVYRERHGGKNGYNLLGWFQLSVDGRLFRLGRLEFELDAKFSGRGNVYVSSDGGLTALADGLTVHRSGRALGAAGCDDPDGGYEAVTVETDAYFEGHPFLEDGSVSPETVRLEKSKWKKLISHGDCAIGVHIPPGGGLTPELVDGAITEARDFFARYFPDHPMKCFVCESWMMDSVLCGILGEGANISLFNRRFHKITCRSSGMGVFHFVYLLGEPKEVDYSKLDESTTLTRGIKRLYLSGGRVRETFGWFI